MKKRSIWGIITESIFPSSIYCICCGSLIDGSRTYSLCDSCIEKLHWCSGKTCKRCGKALDENSRHELCYDCMIMEHQFDKGYTCMTYGLYERKMLLDYKYNGKGYLGKIFAEIMYDRISNENEELHMIVPVPVHKSRMKSRGYNQSEIMSRRLAQLMNIPEAIDVLERTRRTTLLRSMSPVERESELSGAFQVSARGKMRIKNKRILLIDDIYTTGSTVDACSKALKEAGASYVCVMTLASGGNRKPEADSN